MNQDNTNQGGRKTEEGNWQTEGRVKNQSSLGQFPQDQNEYVAGQVAPNEYPEAQGTQAQFLPPAQQYSQTQYQQNPYAQQPQPQNPYQQAPQQPQQYQQDPYQQNPYAQQQYAQNPYQQGAQQQQYPTGYAQSGYQQQQGFQSYDGNEYLSYDQKAGRMVGGVLGTILLVIVVAGLIWGYKMTHPAAVLAPTSYTPFAVNSGAFMIDQPAGWVTDSGGANGVESNATFRSGKAKIYADADLGGSLNGDMIAAQNAQRQSIGDAVGQHVVITPPVITIHREGEAAMHENYANYHEQPMQQFTSALGNGWYSEFTGNAGTFTGNVHGYRATLLTNESRVTVITVCRESDWAALQPAFMHELQSLDRGKGSGQ